MIQKKTVAIFDFCETLVDLQTADEFVIFIHKNNLLPKLNRWIYNSWIWLKKLRIIAVYDRIFRKSPIEKKWLLYSLNGLSESFINTQAELYAAWLKSRINENIWNEFKQTKLNSDLVLVCSGGYDNYLYPFFKEYEVPVIATQLKIVNGKFSGVIEGLDCLGSEKVKRIEKRFGIDFWNDYTIDFYSDSITDMPLFERSNRKLVAYNIKPPIWATESGFETIKWKN